MSKLWFKNSLLGMISVYILIFWYSFAESLNEIDNWDCAFVEGTTWGKFWAMLDNRTGQNELVYPREAIKIAIFNLKAYCCRVWGELWSETPRCKYDKDNGLLSDNHPDSKFLYDHLLDVWLRRLDAMDNLLYKWLVPDPIWKERRDFINKKWSQEAWTTPTDIVPKFNEQWTKNINYILPDREEWNYNTQYQKEWESITLGYSNWPLTNRYTNICEVSAYIYWHLLLNLWFYTRTNWYATCESLSRNVISRNISFTKSIVLKKSNKLLYDNINAHITNYLSQSRLTKLKETIFGIVQAFNVVNKKVIKLIKECS